MELRLGYCDFERRMQKQTPDNQCTAGQKKGKMHKFQLEKATEVAVTVG